jgi:hypothetical protein
MKKLILGLLLIGGGYAVYRTAEGYWVAGYIGLCLAFGYLFKKLPTGDALRLIVFVISFMAIMLGGGVILARQWSETAAGVWIVLCVIFLMVFQNRIKRMIPIFRVADAFEEVMKDKPKKPS